MNELAGSSVVLVHWPEEAAEARRLRDHGVPRLLVVASNEDPPAEDDPLADWIRLPVTDDDLWARIRALERRVASRTEQPVLTGDGRMSFRGRWVPLSPTGEALVHVLLVKYASVASYDELQEAGWPGGGAKRELVRVHMTKLRHTVARIGLEIVAVRDHGYVLQESARVDAEPIRAKAGSTNR